MKVSLLMVLLIKEEIFFLQKIDIKQHILFQRLIIRK